MLSSNEINSRQDGHAMAVCVQHWKNCRPVSIVPTKSRKSQILAIIPIQFRPNRDILQILTMLHIIRACPSEVLEPNATSQPTDELETAIQRPRILQYRTESLSIIGPKHWEGRNVREQV